MDWNKINSDNRSSKSEVARIQNLIYTKQKELDELYIPKQTYTNTDYTKVVGDAYERTYTTGGKYKDPLKADRLRKEITKLQIELSVAEQRYRSVNAGINLGLQDEISKGEIAGKYVKKYHQLPIWKKLIWKLGKEKKYRKDLATIKNSEPDDISRDFAVNDLEKLFNGGRKR